MDLRLILKTELPSSQYLNLLAELGLILAQSLREIFLLDQLT